MADGTGDAFSRYRTEPGTVIVQFYRSPYDQAARIPGARIFVAACGHAAWLSPQGAAVLAQNALATTMCTECIPPEAWFNLKAVPGARDEVRNATSDTEWHEIQFLVRAMGGTWPEDEAEE